jgi:hypothetical protein
MRKLLVGLCLAILVLSACAGQPAITLTPFPAPTPTAAFRVQCYYEGELVFDYRFERAETLEDGTVRVWIGADYVEMEGDCKIVP